MKDMFHCINLLFLFFSYRILASLRIKSNGDASKNVFKSNAINTDTSDHLKHAIEFRVDANHDRRWGREPIETTQNPSKCARASAQLVLFPESSHGNIFVFVNAVLLFDAFACERCRSSRHTRHAGHTRSIPVSAFRWNKCNNDKHFGFGFGFRAFAEQASMGLSEWMLFVVHELGAMPTLSIGDGLRAGMLLPGDGESVLWVCCCCCSVLPFE